MVDYLKTGSEQNSAIDGISSFVDMAAVAGSIVGTAFLLSKTKQGAKFLSEVDPIIGKIGNRISEIGVDGSNRLSISETIRGISHIDQFRKIDDAFAINNTTNVGLLRNLQDAAYDIADWEERELGRQYQTKIFNDIGDALKAQGVGDGQISSLMEFVSSRSTSTVLEKDGRLKQSFIADVEDHWHDLLEDVDGAFEDTINHSINALNNISKQNFETFSSFKLAEENINRAREARQDFLQEIKSNAEAALAKQRKDVQHFTIGEAIENSNIYSEFDFIGHENGNMFSLEGKTVLDRLYAKNDDIITSTLDTIKQLSATKDGYIIDGQIRNTPNINKIIRGANELFHETLPYALSHADDFKNVDNLKVEYLNKYDFKGALSSVVARDSSVQRIGNRLFELKPDGTRHELDASGFRFAREDSYVVKKSKDFSQYGQIVLTNGKNAVFGQTSRKRTSDAWGNNYYTYLNKSIDDLANNPEEKAMLGIRNFGFKRSIDSLNINVKLDNKLRAELLKASEDDPTLRYKIEEMISIVDAKTESEKRRALRNISTEGVKSREFERIQRAAISGRSIKPKLAEDSTSITQKSLYAKFTKSQTIDEAAISEIMASLPADQEKALAFINKLDLPQSIKLNLRDRYNVEQLKIKANLTEITTENHVDALGKDLSVEDAKQIQREINQNPELRRTLNRHLGSRKDYKARYESKKSSSRLIAINKGFDLKGILSDLNTINYKGVGNKIGQGLRGMFSNTNLDHFGAGALIDYKLNFPTAKYHGTDLSIGGSLLYKMGERINEGLNNGYIDQMLGFISQPLGERFSAHFNTGLSLGLSNKDARSTIQLASNLLVKRVLPASIIATQLDWANDTFDINENFQVGWANMDLGFRKFTDATGLTNVFKLAKMANPAAQYISGDYRPYQSYEERLDYYQNGKDPIRSGRYWVWGSTNEFRGSSISYWEDNSLKLAQSDYRNKAIYGSYWDKWARSPIPTLSNPFSPIVYALNPYWLEEKHSEDRPYLLSAPLFEQNTLQGLLLNPTLGELIKPQRRYHQDRMWFGQDVKAIMYQMNQKIQQTADEDNRYIIFQNGRLGVYDFKAFSHPTDIEYIQGQDQEYTGQAPAFATAKDYTNYINSDGTIDASAYSSLQPVSPGVGAAVSAMNSAIQSGSSPYTNASGMYIQQRIRRTRSNKGTVQEMLDNADMYNNLMNSGGGRDYLDELQTTSRLLTGIYGYAVSSVFGRDNSKFIANAGDIDSFTRQFWDTGVGGLGGEQMEVIRRFLPEFSRRQRFNPLMNTMAEKHPWMPEKFYMGDAYCISKNTMVEIGNLDYLAADKVIENQSIITDHTGQNTVANKIVCRKIELKEKVYSLKVNSLFAFDYEFSENHPLLVTESSNNTTKELSGNSLSYYKKANIVLNVLKNGITSKKDLANLVNISINDVCQLWKRMFQDDLIYDYKLDKHNIHLKKYKLYDINLLKNRLSWKKVKDVKVGNYVAYPIPESKNQEIILDLGLLLPEYISTEKYLYKPRIKNKEFIEIYEYFEKHGVPKFDRGERKKLLEKMNWHDRIYESVLSSFKNKRGIKRIPRKFVLTRQMCYAFGLYLAEGWNNEYTIGMAHNINERDYAYNAFLGFKQIDPYINFSFKRVDNTNGAYSHFGSSIIASLLNVLFNKGAHDKKIPEFFWHAKEECVLGLLEGYICGDGSNFIIKSGYDKEIEKISITSCNKKLLYQVRKLLLRFNIVGSINIHNKSSKKIKINKYLVTSGISYNLSVRGKKASILSELLFGKSLLPINHEAKEASHHYINNGYLYLRIENIQEINTVKEVYGYQVNQNNSFCVVGFATHNTSLPNAEARLPGVGYEAINQLHPDQFASDGYGAIDRYKILADIAPNSPEYKYWKQIVKMMNNDEAKKVLKDTEEMVKHQGKKHDFFDYKFLGKTTTAVDGHVEQILSNGKFKIAGDDTLYQIAGVKFKDNGFMSKNQLKQVLTEGSHITLRIDDEERNADPNAPQAPRKAAVFLNGENISDTLREVGLADYDMEDTSAAGAYANYGIFGRVTGTAAEIVAHAPIPIIHSQLMRVNSPLEEYRSDQLYGSGFQSWDDLLGTYVFPTFQQAKTDFARDLISDSIWRFYQGYTSGAITENISKRSSTILKAVATYSNGTALAGEITGRFLFTGANSATRRDQLANAGRHIGNIYSMVTSIQDPMYAAYAWGRFGWDSSKIYDLWKDIDVGFDSVIDYAEEMRLIKPASMISHETGKAVDVIQAARKFKLGRISQAIAFAAAGTAIAVSQDNPITRFFGADSHVYTPDHVKERWDTEDYFDRLRYIKYMALYEAAKEKAKKEEGVDVDKLYKHQEALRAEMNGDVSVTDMMSAILTSGKPADDPIAQWAQKTFGRLSDDMTTLVAGKYTEQAIMFHQVAESTIYALNKDSEYSDIIRALPNTEKEYFVEFAKVTDERQRREILRNVSPSLKKALRLVWYQEDTDTESNESFFERHNLPDPLWAGWDASSNLDNIKAKVIYNEGMQYADYGIYSSSYEDPEVINAPNIDNIHNGSNPLAVRMNLNTVLSGIGLTDKRIQVHPTQDEGVIQVASNITAVLGYKIDKALSFFS